MQSALLITGARQVGKTYTIRESGKIFKSFVEINFIDHPEAVKIIENATNAEDIIRRISLLTNKSLIKNETLIFLY